MSKKQFCFSISDQNRKARNDRRFFKVMSKHSSISNPTSTFLSQENRGIPLLLPHQFNKVLSLRKYLKNQHLDRPNVERPIFRNFEISNINIKRHKLLDFLFSNFVIHFFQLFSNIYDNLSNCKFSGFDSFSNCQI